MTEHSYTIPSHPNPNVLVRWVALIGGIILLLSMLSLWVGTAFIVIMGIALFREHKGHSSWLWHWIPKRPAQIKARWPETTPSVISVQMTSHFHYWLRYGWLIWGLVVLGTTAIAVGFTPAAFSPFLLMGSIWLKVPEQQIDVPDMDSSDHLNITLPSSASWFELYTYLDHHHTEVASQGVLKVPSFNGRPFIVPTTLSEWTSEDIERP